jgi:hypothetical protein
MKLTTPELEQEFIDKVNDDFNFYIEAIPFVEIDDNVLGRTHKLRCAISEVKPNYSIAEIVFELQYLLHRYKQRKDIDDCKLIVSNLILTPIIPDTAFRRGFLIKMKYDF